MLSKKKKKHFGIMDMRGGRRVGARDSSEPHFLDN
jgi:hypothetical protein